MNEIDRQRIATLLKAAEVALSEARTIANKYTRNDDFGPGTRPGDPYVSHHCTTALTALYLIRRESSDI